MFNKLQLLENSYEKVNKYLRKLLIFFANFQKEKFVKVLVKLTCFSGSTHCSILSGN